MKLVNHLLLFLLVLSALTCCQQETDEIRLPLPAEAFNASSTEAASIARTTLHDGSSDNILDGASCTSLKLPVNVQVNGQQLTLTTEDDLKYVERIMDEDDDDKDELKIIYPVTVVLADYTEIVVSNEGALEDLVKNCIEGGSDDDIECIDFLYPVTITLYNTANQVSDVITLNNDASLHNFIESLNEEEWVSFVFPIVMTLFDGTKITIDDNESLENLIKDSSDDCDEDDDIDFDDDDVDDSNLVAVLVNGKWKIKYFFDEEDQTGEFTGFTFTFYANGTASASNGSIEVVGTWATHGDDGELELSLDFGENSPFDEIEEDWEVAQFTTSLLTLKDHVDDEESKTLIFEKP